MKKFFYAPLVFHVLGSPITRIIERSDLAVDPVQLRKILDEPPKKKPAVSQKELDALKMDLRKDELSLIHGLERKEVDQRRHYQVAKKSSPELSIGNRAVPSTSGHPSNAEKNAQGPPSEHSSSLSPIPSSQFRQFLENRLEKLSKVLKADKTLRKIPVIIDHVSQFLDKAFAKYNQEQPEGLCIFLLHFLNSLFSRP